MRFWIGWWDLLTPQSYNSGLQEIIQRYRWSTDFTVHSNIRTTYLSLHWPYPGNGFITVSPSLQIKNEAFLAQSNSFLAIILQLPAQLNSSAPKHISRQGGVSKLDPSRYAAIASQSQSQSNVTTDDQSASLSWNKVPIWGLRPDFHYCQTCGFVDMGRPLWRLLFPDSELFFITPLHRQLRKQSLLLRKCVY
jgi:hypothetical protein